MTKRQKMKKTYIRKRVLYYDGGVFLFYCNVFFRTGAKSAEFKGSPTEIKSQFNCQDGLGHFFREELCKFKWAFA